MEPMQSGSSRPHSAPRLRRGPASRPTVPTETFSGYGVLGVSFGLGDVLAFRHFTRSSIGPGYTAVWHRDPSGLWTFFTDTAPSHACPRYFAAGRARTVRTEIRVEWADSGHMALAVPAHHLDWALRMEASGASTALSGVTALVPRRLLATAPALNGLGAVTGRLLRARPLRLSGATPSGRWFRILPRHSAPVTASAGVMGGRDLGPMGAAPRTVRLGDLVIPDRGLFILGDWTFSSPGQ